MARTVCLLMSSFFVATAAHVTPARTEDGSSSVPNQTAGFHVEQKSDRLIFSDFGQSVGEFVFRDPKIKRPYFANLHSPGDLKVTRNHPPKPGVDANDHDTMHPGLWLGLGDVSGSDFWRNKGKIEHVKFLKEPAVEKNQVRFATLGRLVSEKGEEICELTNRFQLARRPPGWLIVWDAAFQSDKREFTFGDQEEMGFGARVATPLTEKNGGRILNSHGQTTAAKTWGKAALWCDYSGTINGKNSGITLMPDPSNFRESWWHNRDYGVFVANPFGRAAMKHGPKSVVTVRKGEAFRIRFGAFLHDGEGYDPQIAYEDYLEQRKKD